MSEAAETQDPHQIRMRVGHPGGEAEAGRDELGQAVGLPQSLADGPAELLQGVRHRSVEQHRLGLDAVAEGAESDVRPVGDGLHAYTGLTGLREDLPRRTDEGPACRRTDEGPAGRRTASLKARGGRHRCGHGAKPSNLGDRISISEFFIS